MKRKLLFISLLVFIVACFLAVTAVAESYTISYHNLWSEYKQTETTDDNGQLVLKDKGYATDAGKQFFGWYTIEGDFFKPGETATFTADTNVYEAYGYEGTQKSIQHLGVMAGSNQWDQSFVQLQEDIVLDSKMSPPWGGRVIIDLNGYSITTSSNHAFEQQRSGVVIVGEGSVIHTGNGNFFNASTHGYGDGNQRLIIGKNVTVSTNGTLFNYTNTTNSVIPIYIYGSVSCSKLFHITTLNRNLDVQLNPNKLTVTGDVFMTVGKFDGDTAMVSLAVLGGNLELGANATTLNYWHNNSTADYASKCSIAISGGKFNCSADAIGNFVVDGYKVYNTEIDGKAYSIIISNSECAHEYEVTSQTAASCIAFATQTFTCKNCKDSYTISFGALAAHKYDLIEDIAPTSTSVGKKIYKCSVCGDMKEEKYYLDVATSNVTVIVNTADGEKEVTVNASDVFTLEATSQNQYTLKDLKAFGDYKVTDIVAINVPLGIININLSSNNSTLKKLIISDGAVLNITSFSKCSALTHIEIGAAEVRFVKGCSNSVIQSIKSEVSGAEVTFDGQVFDNKTTITELKLSSYSKYTFGANSFRYTNITEFIAPDYSDVTFLSEAAFYKCNSLKYIYIGKGIEVLAGKPFDYCQYVQTIVLMDVNIISMEYTFCVEDSGERPVEVYIHADSISLPNNTFYQCHGVTIYTNAPITNGSVFNNCNETTKNGVYYPAYTIVYGIGHKLVEAYEEPTCTENGVNGYKTDCPCGADLDGSVTVKVFEKALTNNQTYNEETYTSIVIPATGHFEGEVIYVDYINGYMLEGLKDCICRVCEAEYTELVPSADPLFVFLGYSMPEDGRLEITMGFMINNKAIDKYEELTEKTVNYSVVLALENKLNGKAPLDSEVVSFTQKAELDRKLCGFDLKVSGFSDANCDLAVVMAIYVTEGDTTVYLQDAQTNLPTGVSINSLNS